MYRIEGKPEQHEAMCIFRDLDLRNFSKVLYMYLITSNEVEFDDDLLVRLLKVSKSKITRAKRELKKYGYWKSTRLNKTEYHVELKLRK